MRHQIKSSLLLLVMVGVGGTISMKDPSRYKWAIDDLTACDIIKEVPIDTGVGYKATDKGIATYESLCAVLSLHISNYGPVPDNWPKIKEK